jgi:PleD family two-component response regulator
MELHGQTPNSINSGSYLIHDPMVQKFSQPFHGAAFPEATQRSNRQPASIRILIVDDQNFVRRMLQYSLESNAEFEIVGTAGSGATAF